MFLGLNCSDCLCPGTGTGTGTGTSTEFLGTGTFSSGCSSNHCSVVSNQYAVTIAGVTQGSDSCACDEWNGTFIMSLARVDETVPFCEWSINAHVGCQFGGVHIPTGQFTYNLTIVRYPWHPGDTLVQVGTRWPGGANSVQWYKKFTPSDALNCLGSFDLPLTEEHRCDTWPDPITVTAV